MVNHTNRMKHYYQSIRMGPMVLTHEGIYRHAVERAHQGAIFVEVGAYIGESVVYTAVEIINSGKDIQLHVVDKWRGKNTINPELSMKQILDQFILNVQPVADKMKIFIHQQKSVKAAEEFLDGSLDFVFIDAAHDYKSVKEDIIAWYPKVKAGGLLAGHDFTEKFPGVQIAVRELLPDAIVSPHSDQCWQFDKPY